MAQVTLNVDDSLVPRVRAAFGVSTNPQLKTAIIRLIKDKVNDFEVQQAEATLKTAVNTAITNLESGVNTTRTTAESEVVIS